MSRRSRLWQKFNEVTKRENRPPEFRLGNAHQDEIPIEASPNRECPSPRLNSNQQSQGSETLIELDDPNRIWSVAFLADGKHVVSGGEKGKIRCWRVEDGKEVGPSMDAGSAVRNIAVSPHGESIVCGTKSGQVTGWDIGNHSKVVDFKGHSDWVNAVDISPGGLRFATGADDKTVSIWSFSTGERILGPLDHSKELAAVKFSPDGRRLATAMWYHDSLRVYDSQNGELLVDVPISVSSPRNQSLAWTSDSKQIFAASHDGNISCLDAATGATISKWSISDSKHSRCMISLASNHTFIAASDEFSVSFWSTLAHKQIGSVIKDTGYVGSIAISANYDSVVAAGDGKLTIRHLCDILPSAYTNDIFPEQTIQRLKMEKAELDHVIELLRMQDKRSSEKIANLEGIIKQLGCSTQDKHSKGARRENLNGHQKGNLLTEALTLSTTRVNRRREERKIELGDQERIWSVAFLTDGECIVSGDEKGKIRCWRIQDGEEVGQPMDAGSAVRNIAVSPDGESIVSGTKNGQVTVWNVGNRSKEVDFKAHSDWVNAVDVSPDGTRIATGADDRTVSVWSFSTGKLLLGPLKHDYDLAAVKFSPDGRLIATAVWKCDSLRIYNSQTGHPLVNVPIRVSSPRNQSLVWASDSKELFVVSRGSNISRLDASTGETLSKWAIPNDEDSRCMIALAYNDTFIAASNESSVSFWDTSSHTQIGPVIKYPYYVGSIAISAECDIVAGGDENISLRNICEVLPPQYFDDIFPEQAIKRFRGEKAELERTVDSLRTQNESSNSKITSLERTVKQLEKQLADSQRETKEEKDSLQIIQSLRAQESHSNEIIVNLERTTEELRNQLSNIRRDASEKQDHLTQTIQSLRSDLRARDESTNESVANIKRSIQELVSEYPDFERSMIPGTGNLNEAVEFLVSSHRTRVEISKRRILDLERTTERQRAQHAESQKDIFRLRNQLAESEKHVEQLDTQLAESQQRANWERDNLQQLLRSYEQKHRCESLYADGCIISAAESLLDIVSTLGGTVRTNKLVMDWIADFTDRCMRNLETAGDEASNLKKYDEALAAYSMVLSLGPTTPNNVLIKWASTMLIRGSVNETLSAAAKFKLPRFMIYWAICNVLEGDNRITEAVMCFQQMQGELGEDTGTDDERAAWELDFRVCCFEKLDKLGDAAMDSKKPNEALQYYSYALAIGPVNCKNILVKCCKARSCILHEALLDADKAIEDDPSSYIGYQRKHASLHAMGRHKGAFIAFEMMVTKIEESSDPYTRELRHHYVDVAPTIRRIVWETIRHMPRILIDTTDGRLYDKAHQAAAFEQLPIFHELRSSMITRARVDKARIRKEVKKFYRYVMFSHRWEDAGEPLFQTVETISIFELDASVPNIKLQNLCRLVRLLGFQWVWSDTCCIDKKDNVVLQESLVAMFAWYRGSTLTIVHLRGVLSQFQKIGDLRGSIWNTRAWTYQEYIAADTIQFYTEDWKPYLGLTMFNHKESPEIISEMQHAFTQNLSVLQPGSDRVREKLYLASTRQTTFIEDIAYSLLGIFNAAIPVIYGEGYRAVGRLLEHILTSSGDISILAWTGRSGGYNSCLPIDLAVYSQPIPPHVPQPIEMGEMDTTVAALRSSLVDLSLATALHARLDELVLSASFAAGRFRLPCIVFSITKLDHVGDPDPRSVTHVYRATTAMLGDVEIKTEEDLSGMKNLVLVHPWISSMLDQEFLQGEASLDDSTRALRLIVLLRQPFGALLLRLAPSSRVQHKRIAADSLIMVRVREETTLTDLMEGIRVIDVQ